MSEVGPQADLASLLDLRQLISRKQTSRRSHCTVLISRRERDPQVWRKMALGIVLIAALAAPQLAALLFATEPCQGEADDDRACYDHPIWCRAAERRGC